VHSRNHSRHFSITPLCEDFDVLGNSPAVRTGQARRKAGFAALAAALIAVLLSPAASSAGRDHSELHHRKNELDRQIHHQQRDFDEVSSQLIRAQARVNAAVSDLNRARSTLASLRIQVAAAQKADQELQARLEDAIVRLRDARADVDRGHQAVEDQRSALIGFALSSYQSGGLDAMSLGLGLEAQTVQDAVNGVQGVNAVGDKQAVGLQQLQAAQVLLRLTEERVEATKNEVQQKRIEAARQLEVKQQLERQAQAAKAAVAQRVALLRVERQRVAAAKSNEKHRLDTLKAVREKVQDRLRRIAERRARQHGRTLQSPPVGGGGFLSYPVNNTYITSPYGMRLHPILHIWELHDGTDFHASCGTPVYAAAAGRVTEEYYNAGYGNRVIIDHGYVHGVSLWTSYNHLTSFVAHVGQRVSRGELVAYSGTTGYSTACHLHFMVYVNGSTVDPMTWL
jgi:murein DD-endopeptidase MepM/ murein hydrolase activator NlpD